MSEQQKSEGKEVPMMVGADIDYEWEPPRGHLFIRALFDDHRLTVSFDFLHSGQGTKSPDYMQIAVISNWVGMSSRAHGSYHECMRGQEGRTPSGAVIIRRLGWPADIVALAKLWGDTRETVDEWAAKLGTGRSAGLSEASRAMVLKELAYMKVTPMDKVAP